jgi:hypothetical protein
MFYHSLYTTTEDKSQEDDMEIAYGSAVVLLEGQFLAYLCYLGLY